MAEFAQPGSEGLAVPEDFGIPKVTDAVSYEKVPSGSAYIDPKGERRTKPYRIKPGANAASEYAALPEGVPYIDPEGVSRVTPKYEDLDFTTQTLFNMSATDAERRKSLERGYPGKVKENKQTKELYVDDDGTLRRSRSFTRAPGAFLASQAAPVTGAVMGEIAGATTGSVVPGAGTVMGAITGSAIGGASGQAFNDAILSLAGVYDRSVGREAGEIALAGAAGGAGTAIGRGLAAAEPAIKAGIINAFPKFVSDVLGVDPEGLKQALALKAKNPNIKIPISTWAPEAPHFANIQEVFDPAFRLQNPLAQSATAHYETEAGKVLKGVGVEPKGPISEPTASVSTEKAGETVLGRTRAEMQRADEELRVKLDAYKQAAAAGAAKHESQLAALQEAETTARKAAQSVINAGFESIQQGVDSAMKVSKAGHNSGDLWWAVGEQLKAVRAGIASRASKMYDTADALAGDRKPVVTGLAERAQLFLSDLPENFSAQYPQVVKRIRDWAGVPAKDDHGIPSIDGSKWEKEPIEPTWAQLHNLRSIMRQNYNRFDLTPDVKQGTFKFFAQRVDEIINDENASPQLRAAAQQLRAADTFYRENMGPLQDRRIQAVMDGLEAGLPADPKVLFDTIIKEGRSDLTKHLAGIVGPNLWAGVKAADVKEMLDQAKSLVPGQIDGRRFVQQVLERHRNGMLEAVHGKEVSEQLIRQAQNIAMLDGKFDIAVRPNDTVTDVITKARAASEAVKEMAKQDPLGTLNKEMRGIQQEHAKKLATTRRNDPLGFLYDLKLGANEAVDRILGSEDLILAAASRFGDKSPEFNALRQVWAQRILMGTIDPSKRLAKTSEEVQRLMFPGVSLDQMKTLAKEMDFLTSSAKAPGAGKSIAATEHVEHPWGFLPGGRAVSRLPGIGFVGRVMLGKYFKFISEVVDKPWVMRLAEKGIHGDPKARLAIKDLFTRRTRLGGVMGAAYGEILAAEPTHGRDSPNPSGATQ